jgi:hypothetical protein
LQLSGKSAYDYLNDVILWLMMVEQTFSRNDQLIRANLGF